MQVTLALLTRPEASILSVRVLTYEIKMIDISFKVLLMLGGGCLVQAPKVWLRCCGVLSSPWLETPTLGLQQDSMSERLQVMSTTLVGHQWLDAGSARIGKPEMITLFLGTRNHMKGIMLCVEPLWCVEPVCCGACEL